MAQSDNDAADSVAIINATTPSGGSPALGPVSDYPALPTTLPPLGTAPTVATLSLMDGTSFQGISFGAEVSIAGECVFQTGMVGYPESLTDPSYRGQILVLTYPLVGNYGVPDLDEKDPFSHLPLHFESQKIHVAGLLIGNYSQDFSHHLAKSSLSKWLIDSGIPALYAVDTRALTKKIRNKGVILGKILFPKDNTAQLPPFDVHVPWISFYNDIPFEDPNNRNLVAEVSTKTFQDYYPDPSLAAKGVGARPDGKPIRILCIDVGMKYNQIRCFLNRGASVRVAPWDTDILAAIDGFDGLFISNGPGDPTMCGPTIENLRKVLAAKRIPIFGICLGHQLLALAAGARTKKMKYGNRGQNIPCTSTWTGRCYITSQNHGYAVEAESLPTGWKELFINANDASNEGIFHEELPYFSVQFHPESAPGPRDSEFLFDTFLQSVKANIGRTQLLPLHKEPHVQSPPKVSVRKVLILGSGGLSIGQAGEFDYSGSQAIKALKEEKIYTILINPNIATIQTSKGMADKVYFLPVNAEFVRKVIKYECPDGIYVTFGGQTALNVGVQLKDEFEDLGVKVLGTPIDTIIVTEDRELFARRMAEINEKCAMSQSATTLDDAIKAGSKIGFPVIVRAAYALGGLGSGFASNEDELIDLCRVAFAVSPQVLIERSMKGWKEIEYEVVRDCNDNCITVCNMENFDPLGIHTGDSIVVAPSQTLSDRDYNRLRTTAVNVIRHLGVVGECNIQYALNPNSEEYCIIEVNARLSRSSALASKATGYPLAFVAAKLGLNIPLTDIKNSVTKVTSACFEPSLDYCVVKIPRWDLKKFNRVSKKISSSMKSVGEVMAIGRTFEETIQKAIQAVDYQFIGFATNDFYLDNIDEELANPSDVRLFAIANALHAGYSVDRIWELTKIDRWFLNRLKTIVTVDKTLANYVSSEIPTELVRRAKQLGFSDRHIARTVGKAELAIRKIRQEAGITPFVKQIDTVAAEFPAHTNYLFMTYNAVENDVVFEDKGVLVLGSGVYRIGSSVEFDWCAVRCIRTLRSRGLKAVMINYNPETVSTDYDEADRLYFENITLERVLDIYEIERSSGVILSMGGQTPNNIALPLQRQNVTILGTSPEQIDNAENRYKFSRMLDRIEVDQPMWKELTSLAEAREFCAKVSYPVLVRPSYVLSGAAMNVVNSPDDLDSYLNQAVAVSPDTPVVISKFITEAKEIEMDAVAKDGQLIMHVVSEHVENAGVHSGDATLILPPQDLDPQTVAKVENATRKIARALNVTGPFNIQFIAKNNEIKVIECNLRASRSFPFVSKTLGVDLIEMATLAMIGAPVEPYPRTEERRDYVAVKVPQFSFSRLSGADPVLGVEMASTGEVACFGKDKYEAYLKALISTGFKLPKKNILLSIGSFKEKTEFLPFVRRLHEHGFAIYATPGTGDFIREHGVPVNILESFEDSGDNTAGNKSEYSLNQHLANNLIDLYINLPSNNRFRRPASYMSRGYLSRRMAVDFSIPLITNIKCAKLFVEALTRRSNLAITLLDYKTSHRTVVLPGLVDVAACVSGSQISSSTRAALAGGFTTILASPLGPSLKDASALNAAHHLIAEGDAACDYAVYLSASAENVVSAASLAPTVASLLVSLQVESVSSNLSHLNNHLRNWSAATHHPVVANVRGSELATVLFLASLSDVPVHVTGVSARDDLFLIIASKSKGYRVTCDVPVQALFGSELLEDGSIAESDDVAYLWENLEFIDCFSTGIQNLARAASTEAYTSLLAEALPLLLTAVSEGRLTLDTVVDRLYTNPRRIFDLPEQPDTFIEVEMDREQDANNNTLAKVILRGRPLLSAVHRVVLRGVTVYLDGRTLPLSSGIDVRTAVTSTPSAPPSNQSTPSASVIAGNLAAAAIVSTPQSRPRLHHDAVLSPNRLQRTSSNINVIGSETDVLAAAPASLKTTTSTSVQSLFQASITAAAAAAASAAAASAGSASSASAEASCQLRSSGLSNANLAAEYLAASGNVSPFFKQHVLSVKGYSRYDLHALFGVAQEMRTLVERGGSIDLLTGVVMCNLFYEPSTRTSASFEAAMLRLGGKVVSVKPESSSIAKGESLADTVRTVGSYCDAIIIRHPEPGSAQVAAKFSKVPVINAGDGVGEHPTQAFLDIFTIREELGTVNGLNITLVGDLKNGRTVHSLVRMLSKYDVRLTYVSPRSLRMPEEVKNEARRSGVSQKETESLDDVIATTDVLYVTRIQKERFASLEEYESVKNSYIITTATLARAKSNMIVMHPLPRVNEIDPEVDFDSRAAYFRQMRYGLYVRMALLLMILGK